MSELLMAELSTVPSTPSTGKVSLYFRAGAWYYLDDSGVEVPFAATVVNPAFIDFITSGTNPAHLAGRLFWDVENNTLAFHTDISGVTNQLGQEIYVRGRNISGGTLLNGRAVYISGVSAGRPRFDYAVNNNPIIAGKTIGILAHNVANANEGYATVLGSVGDLNTSAWAAGDVLYLDTSNGQLTNVKPTPSLTTMIVRIGVVLISDATTGRIFVTPDITPIITDIGGAGTLAQQNANAVAITGGAINNTPIGGTTRAAGNFTNLDYNGTLIGGTGVINIGGGQFYKDAAGNIGVGVAPSAKFHVESATTQTTLFRSTSTGTGDISDLQIIGNDVTLRATAYGSNHAARGNQVWLNSVAPASSLILAAGNAEALRVSPARNLCVGTGADNTFAKIQSSNGMTLGNTANANPTVLDWYEEGTWTPTLRFGGVDGCTYASRVGDFTRKGREVTLTCDLALSALGTATGNASLSGFPFISKAGVSTVTIFQGDSITFTGTYPFAYQPGNSTDCALFGGSSSAVFTQLTHANFSNSSTLRLTITYNV